MITPPRFRLGLLAAACAALLSATVSLAATLAEVRFATYRAQFTRGDSIVIEQVSATSARWRTGDTLVVRGRYNLTSQDGATLAIFITASNPGDGRSVRAPGRRCASSAARENFSSNAPCPTKARRT